MGRGLWRRMSRGLRQVLGAWLAFTTAMLTVNDLPAQKATGAMPPDHPLFVKPGTAPRPRLAPETVVARIDDDTITAGDLDTAINALSAPDRFEYTSPEAVRDLVEALIDRRLMARAARAAGLDEQMAAGEQRAQEISEDALAEAWLAREARRLAPPGETEIARYYRDHAAEFTVPARVRVTRVVAATKANAEPLRAALARGASVTALRERYGGQILSAESLWLQDTPKRPELVAMALGLKPGEVSAVLAVASGFTVLRAEETVAARLRPLPEVRDGIATRLSAAAHQEAREAMRNRLRSGARISVLDEALMSYSPPFPGPPPGAIR